MNYYRRCSVCDLDWPDDVKYAKCAKCATVTGRMPLGSKVAMDRDEAENVAAYARFERYLAGEETDAERDARKRGIADRMKNKDVGTASYKKFQKIMERAGYTEDEIQQIAELESLLPRAHQIDFKDQD